MTNAKEPWVVFQRQHDGWYWRLEYVKGYFPYEGPYPSERDARIAGNAAKRYRRRRDAYFAAKAEEARQ